MHSDGPTHQAKQDDTLRRGLRGTAVGVALFAVLGTVTAVWANPLFVRMTPVGPWEFGATGAYFHSMHFLSFHRATPPPNPLQPWFIGLVGLVLGLRVGAYPKTIRAKAPSELPGEEASRASV